MSDYREFLEPDLGRSTQPLRVVCARCGYDTRVFSSAAWNLGVCDRCLPENPDPELQRLLQTLKDDAWKRNAAKGRAQ